MKHNTGFTLIEVIVSLFLLSILSISFLFTTTFYMSTMARATYRFSQVQQGEEVLDQVVRSLEEGSTTAEDIMLLEENYSTNGLQVSIQQIAELSALEVTVSEEEDSWRGFHTLVQIP